MRGTRARTEHGDYRFTVKEGGSPDYRPWITTEPRGQGIPALKHAFIGFELPDGTTITQAKKIADFMNKNLVTMSLTMFGTHPLYEQRTVRLVTG